MSEIVAVRHCGDDPHCLVEQGTTHLRSGDWAAARDCFLESTRHKEASASIAHPEALHGLGIAQWWLGDMNESISNLEQAYAGFRRRGDAGRAAVVALRIGIDSLSSQKNRPAAGGWLSRARRLVEQNSLEELRGELLLLEACCTDDLRHAEETARRSLEYARTSSDLDLELCTLSWLGVLLIEQGRVAEGLPLLDESMAGALSGEAQHLDTVVFTSCNVIVACARCAAHERAAQWVRASRRFAQRYGCPFLLGECRAVYGTTLFATGDWAAADHELRRAIALTRESLPTYQSGAIAALADLRVGQGRFEEARSLLRGMEGHEAAVPVLARLELSVGNPELAANHVQRRLEALERSRIERAFLLEILGEVRITTGRNDDAAELGDEVYHLGAGEGCRVVLARGERLRGYARRDTVPARSRQHLDRALSEFIELNMPFETARTRLMLAEVLRRDMPELAAAEARSAFVSFSDLGATPGADAAAALLRGMGVTIGRTGTRGGTPLTRREREVFALLGAGLSNPQIAERLFISRKTVEHHVSHILARLGLSSRAEAAAEAATEAYRAQAPETVDKTEERS